MRLVSLFVHLPVALSLPLDFKAQESKGLAGLLSAVLAPGTAQALSKQLVKEQVPRSEEHTSELQSQL